MSDDLYLNNYLGCDHKQQRVKYFYELNKVIQTPLQHVFYKIYS